MDIFQIWSKIFKSDLVFVYKKKSLFLAFWGPAKVSRPLVIRCWKQKKPQKIELAGLAGPKCTEQNFGPFYHAISKFLDFIGWTNRDKLFVVQKPNLKVFGFFEVYLSNKRAFGLVGQPQQLARKKFRPLKLKFRFL